MAEASRANPDYDRAVKLHASGALAEAVRHYEAARRAAPADARPVTKLGLIELQQQRLDAAAALFTAALALDPSLAEPHAWLGETRRRQHALDAAVAEFDAALALDPGFAPALYNLGLAEAERGHRAAAALAWERFHALRPADPGVCRELGRLAERHGDLEAARRWFARQCERAPQDADATCDYAGALIALQEVDAAFAALAPLARRSPPHLRALKLQGQALLGCEQREEALAKLREAAAIDPNDAGAALLTGLALDRLSRLDEAIAEYERAAALAPASAKARSAVGVAQMNRGDIPEAIGSLRRALALDPDFGEAHDNLLLALYHADPPDHEEILREHRAWAARHAAMTPRPRAAFANPRDPARRLKIGYLSPRLKAGPLASFLLPLLAAQDAGAFHVTCYSASPRSDATTTAIRSYADDWRDVTRLTDDALAEAIRADGIDVLVDLAGHCPGHRLGAFARRAAPVQITWLDYVGTTGVPAMDYVVTDALLTPADSPQRYTEQLLRLPDTRLAYRPPASLPPLAAAPSAAGGAFTFGSFNRLNKTGTPVLATWAAILARVPAARLVLKAQVFEAATTRAAVHDRFARLGIAPDRVELRPFSTEAQMLREYGDLDVVLDPFPHNGCTTTCDALAMGVPVITLAGTTLAGRQGLALLTLAGCADGIAATRDEYVELAVRAAARGGIPLAERAARRERFLASPLCDGARFARGFERACRDAWSEWCAESG